MATTGSRTVRRVRGRRCGRVSPEDTILNFRHLLETHAPEAAFAGPGKVWGVMRKTPRGGALHPLDEDINRIIAKVRARVEHPFHVLKRQFGYMKTRYRGLAKNRAQLFTLFALGNLFLVRRKLLA